MFCRQVRTQTVSTVASTLHILKQEESRKNNAPVGGCGWNIDGKKKYNEIFQMVVEDRKKSSYHFNQELLKMFQQRRRNEAAKRGQCIDSEGMLLEKKRPFQCLDEFKQCL
jgi:hypothetical protein